MQEIVGLPKYESSNRNGNSSYLANFLFFGTELFKTSSGMKKTFSNPQFNDFTPNDNLNFEFCLNGISKHLENYFKLLSMKTDDLSILFSGGLDSTILLLFAKKFFKNNLRCYNFYTRNSKFDERQYVKIICEDLDVDCKFFALEPTKEIKELNKILPLMTEPEQSISPFLLYRIMPHIKEKYVVMGEGSEDFFVEGKDYLAVKFLSSIFSKKYDFLSFFSKFKSIFPSLNVSQLSPEVKLLLGKISSSRLTTFQRYNFLRTYIWDFSYCPQSRKIIPQHFDKSIVFPFFYPPLYKFLLRMPLRYKINSLSTRFILKQLLRENIPDEVIARKKIMYVSPMKEWYDVNKKVVDKKLEELLENEKMRNFKNAVRNDLQNMNTRNVNHYRRVWSLFWLSCMLNE